jgi:hypothetical protein
MFLFFVLGRMTASQPDTEVRPALALSLVLKLPAPE